MPEKQACQQRGNAEIVVAAAIIYIDKDNRWLSCQRITCYSRHGITCSVWPAIISMLILNGTRYRTFNVYFKMHVCYIDLSTNYILALRDVSLNTYTLIYRDCLLIRKQLLKHVKKITCITRVDRCTTLCQHTAVPTRGGNEVIPAIHERILQGRQDYGGSNSS